MEASVCFFFQAYSQKAQNVIHLQFGATQNEKALKCKPSALVFGRGCAKDACARQVHTLNEHVTESIRKKQKRRPIYMAVVLVAATSSSLPYYSR